jgi:hypothetical protein
LKVQKSKNKSLKNQSRASEQKRLASENKSKLLKQEFAVFRFKYKMGPIMEEDSTE